MRCGLSAIIPVAHEKNGASTGLKYDLAEQAQSTPFQTLTMDISVLYMYLHFLDLLSPKSRPRNAEHWQHL